MKSHRIIWIKEFQASLKVLYMCLRKNAVVI